MFSSSSTTSIEKEIKEAKPPFFGVTHFLYILTQKMHSKWFHVPEADWMWSSADGAHVEPENNN